MFETMCQKKNNKKILMNKVVKRAGQKAMENGFTFVEVLAAVAIIVILLAVSGVAVAQHRVYLQITELDNAAREIYLAAENRAVLLAGAGRLDGLVSQEANALNLNNLTSDGEPVPSGYYITEAYEVMSELLPAGSIEQTLRDGYFYIIYEPQSGCVTDVFFAERPINQLGESDFQSFYDKWSQADRRSRMKSQPMLGYFGGGLAQGADIGMVSTATVLVEIENAERLTVKVSCQLPGALTLADTDLQVELICGSETILLSDLNYADRRTQNADGYTWLLDSLDGPQFKELSQYIQPGADFTVKAVLTSPENKFLPVSNQDTNNSLFAYTAESNGDIASLQYLRHLQNLSSSFSGVSGKTQAVQIADIHGADNETYSGYEFKPLVNSSLQEYSGGQLKAYAVYNLLVTPQSVGGRSGGLFARAENMNFNNVRLINAHVEARDNVKKLAAGALVGEANYCTFTDCQVYWQPTAESDLRGLLGSDAEGSAYQYQIVGNDAGGLIGIATGDCRLENCLAATLVQGNMVAGGLVGRTLDDIYIEKSYADCYLSGNTLGGLVGYAEAGLDFINGYVAGYMDITAAQKVAGLCCGGNNVKVYTKNVYSVMLRIGQNNNADFYELTESQATVNVDQFDNTYYLGGGKVGGSSEYQAEGKSYADMTAADFVGQLGGNFDRKTARQSHPYNLREHLQLVVYSFPGLQNLPHYGDWGAQFKEPSLVYYEHYSDGSYGFSGGNARYLINELHNVKTVIADGYAVAFLTEDLNGASQIKLDYSWFEGNTKKTVVQTLASSSMLSASGKNEEGNLAQYYLAPLPEELVNAKQTSADFYRYLKFTLSIGNKVPVGGEYFYNPHFAETVVPYVQLESSPMEWTAAAAAQYAAELTGDLNAISIRTPRHLHALSTFVEYYHNEKYNYNFRQNLALNYASYTGYNLFAEKNEQGIFAQKPIGSYAQPFKGVYNGGSRSIEGVAFYAPQNTKPYYAGLFGYSEGLLRDIVYLLDADKYITLFNSDGSVNLYVGGLLGGNAGTVQNCAVAGLNLKAYVFGANLYAGGLIGQNNGIVRDCGAETANLLSDNSGYANSWLGGLVGQNTRNISNTYAVGRLSVAVDKTSSADICGFVGDNTGTISSCYAAADLQSSGLGASTFGFGAQGGLNACYFLNDGNFTYRDKSYIASYAASMATAVSYADLATNNTSLLPSMQLPAAGYPYPSALRNGGEAVHYGEWPVPMELGEMGVYYWEKLELGGKASYHISLLAVDPGKKSVTKETTLSEAYNDGGVVTDFGYGYYNKKNGLLTVTSENIYYTSDGNDNETFKINVGRDEIIDQQLAALMPDFEFHSWHSFQPDADNPSGIYPYKIERRNPVVVRDGSLSLKQGNIEVKFMLNPHFAGALSVASKMGADWQVESDIQNTPGSEQNPYGVRAVAQLELINWNIDNRNTRTVLEMNANNDRFPYLSYPEHTDKYYWRQSHDLDGKMQEYTPIAEYYDTLTENKNLGYLHGWFGGVYDGADYVIANMNIKGQVASCAGLFGVVYNGTLKNIILYSSDGNGVISASGRQTDAKGNVLNKSKWYAIGGLAGVAASSSGNAVQNCAVAGYTIDANIYTASGGWGGGTIGGLVGISNMMLSGCTADTIINITGDVQNNDNMRVGGLAGSCQQSITNCYTGGTINVNSKASISGKLYIGGIVGGSYMKPLQVGDNPKITIGFVDDPGGPYYEPNTTPGWTDNSIIDCYSYVKLPANNAHDKIGALYVLGGTGDILTKAEDTKNEKHNHGTCIISNSYYSDSIRPTVIGEQKTDINRVGEVTALSYMELHDYNAMAQRLPAFTRVTDTIGGNSLAGKYSFPPSSRTELQGRDYPFPTILTRPNPDNLQEPFHVHYGAWPNFGIERAEGGAPIGLDIFAQSDYTEQLELTGLAEGGSWSVSVENALVATAQINAGYLQVQAVGVGTTRLTVIYSLNGSDYQLDITVNVTAELHLSPQAVSLFGTDTASVPVQLLNKQRQPLGELPGYNADNFKLTAVNSTSSYFKATLATTLPPGIVLSRNEQELTEPLSELVNISYTYLYNDVTYSGSEAVEITLWPAPELKEFGPAAYRLTFVENANIEAVKLGAGFAADKVNLTFVANVISLLEVQPDVKEIPLEISLDIDGQKHFIKMQTQIPGEPAAFALLHEVYAVKPDTNQETEEPDAE